MTRYGVFSRDSGASPWDGRIHYVLHDYQAGQDLKVCTWDITDDYSSLIRAHRKAALLALRDDLNHGGARTERALRRLGR